MTIWDILLNIPARAPIWVWPLLAWMIWDGARAMRYRTVGIWFFWAMPLFGLIALRGRLETAAPEVDLPVFLAAYVLGLRFGHWFQGHVIVEKAVRHVIVRGEALTLIMLMIIFWINFARGVIAAISPDLLANLGVVACLAIISGFVAGQFAGRAIRVLQAPRSRLVGA